jgi:FMN phosphatase YigB (HAD superfamily)
MHIFFDLDRTLFDTERFYNALEATHIAGVARTGFGHDWSSFLYPDVTNFLEVGRHHGWKCHLVTYGDRTIQEYKFKACGITHYFTELFYVEQGEKADFIKKYAKGTILPENIVFIDDCVGHLETFIKVLPAALPIRMCRPKAKGSDMQAPTIQTVSSLTELLQQPAFM